MSGEVFISQALLQKCFIAYSPDNIPSLHSVPIMLDGSVATSTPSIALSSKLMTAARQELNAAFSATTNPTSSKELPVTAVCAPHYNSHVAVDAAVRLLAYELKADVVIMDPEDFAAGRKGVLGEALTEALWGIYSAYLALEVHEGSQGSDKPTDSKGDDFSTTDLATGQGRDLASPAEPEWREDRWHAKDAGSSPDNANVEDANQQANIRARAALNAYLQMGETESGRRRVLYIRDYGACYKVLLPLLPALLDIMSTKSNIVVLLGISPVERIIVPNDRRADDKAEYLNMFLTLLRSPKVLDFLDSRQNAQCRKTCTCSKCKESGVYHGLEDVFTAAFINRYQGAGLQHRLDNARLQNRLESMQNLLQGLESLLRRPTGEGPDQERPHGTKTDFKLRFERILRVGCTQPIPRTVADDFAIGRRRRFLLANLRRLQEFTNKESKVVSYDNDIVYSPERTWYVQFLACTDTDSDGAAADPAQRDALKVMESRALERDVLERISNWLPTNSTLLNVLANVQQEVADDLAINDEWLKITKDGNAAVLHVIGESASVAANRWKDPIVERVRREELSDDERSFMHYVVDIGVVRTTFEDVCLKSEVVEALRSAVSLPILYPNAFDTGILARETLGGVLLFGPPGTGKTMACRALAKECGARMLQLTASNILTKCVGESEKLVRAVFSLARRLSPCVIFIDELDAMFQKRNDSTRSWERSLMTEFMQLAAQQRVIVIGATNRPQDLDPALVRRLSRRVLVDLPPTDKEKVLIIKRLLKGEMIDETIDFDNLAKRTKLFSGSDLRHLVVSAALSAFKESTKVSWDMDSGTARLHQPAQGQLSPRIIGNRHFERALGQISACGAINREQTEQLRNWRKELFQLD